MSPSVTLALSRSSPVEEVGVRRAIWAAALFALAFATACTSSAGPPTPGPVGDSSADTSSTPLPVDPTTPAAAERPDPDRIDRSTKPLSPFEQDPAVQAPARLGRRGGPDRQRRPLRQLGPRRADDAGFAKTMKQILGNSVGYRYPGPIPFTPDPGRRHRVERAADRTRASSARRIRRMNPKPASRRATCTSRRIDAQSGVPTATGWWPRSSTARSAARACTSGRRRGE